MDFGGDQFVEQQLALRRKITETKTVDQLDIVLLLDDSSSISDGDFAVMGQVCERICLELTTKNSRFAAIAFHRNSTIICEFHMDKAVVLNAIKSYKRISGSTNLIAGLDNAAKIFEGARGRNNAKRVTFIITDGVADKDPSAAALKLKLMNVTSYCIGVGKNIGMDSLQKISSFGCSLLAKDMDQVINLFNSPASNDQVIHDFHVIVQATITKTPIRFQENVELRIDVNNIGHNVIPAGVMMGFFGDPYFHTSSYRLPFEILHGSMHSFEVSMRTTRKSFGFIPDSITFTITHPQGSRVFCDHNQIALSSELFIGSFLNYKPTHVEELNILLFGVIGCGKSSFLNSILSAFSSKVEDPALIGGDQDHITRNYRRFKMGDQLQTVKGLPINLWDTWGLDGETYTSHLLRQLLEGDVPHDFQMENVKMDGTVMPVSVDETADARRIHGVLLFVPIGILEDEVLTVRVSEVLKSMNQKSLQTLIIVTRADTIEASTRFVHQHAIAKKFNVPDYKVCLVTNYITARDKDFAIDKVTLRIFAEITQIADSYAKTYCAPSSPSRKTTSADSVSPSQKPLQRDDSNLNLNLNLNLTRNDLSSITVHFGSKKATLAVNETTTFESLLASVAQKAKVPATDYCLASQYEGGVEYALKDLVRAGLQVGETEVYMRKDEF